MSTLATFGYILIISSLLSLSYFLYVSLNLDNLIKTKSSFLSKWFMEPNVSKELIERKILLFKAIAAIELIVGLLLIRFY